MDWFIKLDKDTIYLVIYSMAKTNPYRGEEVIKIPMKDILNKYNELFKDLNTN